MARLITDIALEEHSLSDWETDAAILDIVTKNEDLEQVLKKEKRWPVVYQLSHLRYNILNWYPFIKDAELLEIGAGCGALTGFFCDRAAHVSAVELDRNHAEVNYRRNAARENLDIYAGNIFEIGLDRKFDYVTVVGLLEYAALLSQGNDPYTDLLCRAKSFLKPGGHILLAIENRFGLKYFAGAREDHTVRFFEGINGYPGDGNVRTFSKRELEKLLDGADLTSRRFYYPLPDYKFPSSIYTDETIAGFDRWMDLGTLDNQRFELFSEIGVMCGFAGEGILDRFANSFIVDIVADGSAPDSSVLMAKLSATRNPQYRIATVIKQTDGVKTVEKLPLDARCVPHLRRMADNYTRLGSLHGIGLVPCRTGEDGRAIFDFAAGEKFSALIAKALSHKGLEALWPLLDGYRKKLFEQAKTNVDFYTDEFREIFGKEVCENKLACVCPANIDLTFDNLVLNDDGSMTAVDYEWIADFPVPAEYIFWRSIFFTDIFITKDTLKKQIFDHYGLTKAMCKTFYSWEIGFSTNEIGSMTIEGKANIKLDLNLVDPRMQHGEIVTTVAFDFGKGFDMENATTYRVLHLDQPCTLKIPVKAGVRSVRLDPIEGFACQCHINWAKTANGPLTVQPLNCTASDEGNDFFLTLDPVYVITGSFEKANQIEVSFTVCDLDTSLAEMAISKLSGIDKAKLEQLEAKNRELQGVYDAVVNSKSWKLTAPIRKCKKVFGNTP